VALTATTKSPMQEMTTTKKEIFSKRVSLMFGLSLDSWNAIMVGFLALGACAALIVVFSQWVIIRLQKTEAQEAAAVFERFKLETGKEIADANARQKEAELKLAQLRKLAGPRDIKFDVFRRELEGKPKAPVVIWYLPDSSDGYWFASRSFGALASMGWVEGLSGPTPIPEPDQNNLLIRDMPRAVVAGGQPWGVTVVGDSPMGTSPDPKADTPFNALFHALSKSTDFGMYGSSGSQFSPVPKGTLRVVVAAKADPMFRDNPPKATNADNP